MGTAKCAVDFGLINTVFKNCTCIEGNNRKFKKKTIVADDAEY